MKRNLKVTKKNRTERNLQNAFWDSQVKSTPSEADMSSKVEDTILKQFEVIQKDTKKLMEDISVEYNLISQWISDQATEKRNLMKKSIW
ncbi:MAG: hypothetical protein ACOYL6_16430 [Bacteriovoracaceae bacterium]